MSLDYNLEEAIIRTYRGWDSFEKRTTNSEIIDFDLAKNQEEFVFETRTQILERLEEIERNISGESYEEVYLKKKVHASIYYLYACLGERIPFDEYIENTLGISPMYFGDKEIENLRDKIEGILSQFGIQFKIEDKQKYEENFLITNHDSLIDRFNNSVKFWSERLKKYIDFPEKAMLKMEFVNIDASWANWISVSLKKGFELKINLHPRKLSSYSIGYPSFLASHEYCAHIIQGQIWEQNILSGKLKDVCAFTTVHGPEQLGTEGLGEVLSFILARDEEITIEENLARQMHKHFEMVKNNIHIMINKNVAYKDVLNYGKDMLPFESELGLEKLISEKSNNPLSRVYQYSYGIGEYYLEKILDYPFEKQKQILNELYNKPLVKEQIDEIFMKNINNI